MDREQNHLKLFFEQCKRNQAGNYRKWSFIGFWLNSSGLANRWLAENPAVDLQLDITSGALNFQVEITHFLKICHYPYLIIESDDRFIFDIEAAESLLKSQTELYYDLDKENALHWCVRHASKDHIEILIQYLIVHESTCLDHLLRENVREESPLGILIEKSKLRSVFQFAL